MIRLKIGWFGLALILLRWSAQILKIKSFNSGRESWEVIHYSQFESEIWVFRWLLSEVNCLRCDEIKAIIFCCA